MIKFGLLSIYYKIYLHIYVHILTLFRFNYPYFTKYNYIYMYIFWQFLVHINPSPDFNIICIRYMLKVEKLWSQCASANVFASQGPGSCLVENSDVFLPLSSSSSPPQAGCSGDQTASETYWPVCLGARTLLNESVKIKAV